MPDGSGYAPESEIIIRPKAEVVKGKFGWVANFVDDVKDANPLILHMQGNGMLTASRHLDFIIYVKYH